MHRSSSKLQARAGAAPSVTHNVFSDHTRLAKLIAPRKALSAALPRCVTGQPARRSRLCTLRTYASTEVNAANNNMGLKDDEEIDFQDDDEFAPPPLPASALELLSEVLTGIAASNMGSSTTSFSEMHVSTCRRRTGQSAVPAAGWRENFPCARPCWHRTGDL
jgi:hypothetical protein